ncbi:MAG: bifunctional DNA-formamidopyrimidine glycosylase/DNA-(apurinic or apyrimidinic site) lyase [Alphaproteobacteria bacterium]
MPELPEVETVVLGISKYFQNKKIKDISITNRNLRIMIPQNLEKNSVNQTINKIQRRAKYILLGLSNEKTLIVHLGMSGKIRIINNDEADSLKKHDHVVMSFYDSEKLFIYNDARRFGCFTICETKDLEQNKLLKDIGVEPLSDDFNQNYTETAFKNHKMNIKTTLLNQKIIAGIGNIYACEALFRAGISPLRPACDLKKEEIAKLITAVKSVLSEAIASGGTTIRDYATPSGDLGYFANKLDVYGREGQKCHNSICKSSENNVIKKIVQNNRSTFYCANCQH